MTLQDAIDDSADGYVIAWTKDGRIAAEVLGPGPWLSKRKRKKMARGLRVTVWTPPRTPPRDDGRPTLCGSTAVRQPLSKFPHKTRCWINSLDWRPRAVHSAIDRLASLI